MALVPRARHGDACLQWPADAERRSPSRHPDDPMNSGGTPFARGCAASVLRVRRGEPGPARRALRSEVGLPAAASHSVAGILVNRRAVALLESPLHVPLGGAAGRAERGSSVNRRLGHERIVDEAGGGMGNERTEFLVPGSKDQVTAGQGPASYRHPILNDL
jgi:hypothetical protein